jgi:hypothetical protein
VAANNKPDPWSEYVAKHIIRKERHRKCNVKANTHSQPASNDRRGRRTGKKQMLHVTAIAIAVHTQGQARHLIAPNVLRANVKLATFLPP